VVLVKVKVYFLKLYGFVKNSLKQGVFAYDYSAQIAVPAHPPAQNEGTKRNPGDTASAGPCRFSLPIINPLSHRLEYLAAGAHWSTFKHVGCSMLLASTLESTAVA
jgi:hypothetical protein